MSNMAVGPDALAKLQETLRQLRAIPQVREERPGSYALLGKPFLRLHDDAGALSAELRKASGSGFDRFRLDAAPDQRKLVDEAKRRATRFVDEA